MVSETEFKSLNIDEFHQKCEGDTLEGHIYKSIRSLLSNYENQVEIRKEFPKKTVERRNTGYAVDVLLETAPFTAGEPILIFVNSLQVQKVHWLLSRK